MKTKINNWNREAKKEARYETIVKPYKQIFNLESLPENKSYWSLCGNCVKNGEIYPGSEPAQLIEDKFLQANQFNGVENNKTIFNNLSKCKQVNFYHGNIFSILTTQRNDPNFNPGIINLDFLKTAKSEMNNFKIVLDLFKNYHHLMIVANFCLSHHGIKIKPESIIEEINSINSELINKYEPYTIDGKPIIYKYVSNKFDMGSVIFYRR